MRTIIDDMREKKYITLVYDTVRDAWVSCMVWGLIALYFL